MTPAAAALARADIDIVSLANNHAWDYGQSALAETLERLDAASGRVRVDEVGQTTQGRPFVVVTVTSEVNHARLEEIRQLRLHERSQRDAQGVEHLFDVPVGLGVLNSGIILGLMAAPIMTSIAEDALKAVPDPYRAPVQDLTVHPQDSQVLYAANLLLLWNQICDSSLCCI